MPVVRIYVPIGRRELDDLAETGVLAADHTAPRDAFAVTDTLRSRAMGLDLEDLEYAAFSDAVAASGAARSRPDDRRVVAAADADPDWVVTRDAGPVSPVSPVSSVDLVAPVPVNRIASFHVDENPVVGADVSEGRASEGDTDELLWYDVTELDEVRDLLA